MKVELVEHFMQSEYLLDTDSDNATITLKAKDPELQAFVKTVPRQNIEQLVDTVLLLVRHDITRATRFLDDITRATRFLDCLLPFLYMS